PYAGVAGVRQGVFVPRVCAIFTRLGNGVENPEPLAGVHIEAANIASDISAALRIAAGEVRRADDHHILGDERRGMQAYLAGHKVDFLIVVELEIDRAAFAEAGN